MMTGAAPAKTQQLLDKSLIQKSSARGLICVKGNLKSLNQTASKFRRISFYQEVDQLFFKSSVLPIELLLCLEIICLFTFRRQKVGGCGREGACYCPLHGLQVPPTPALGLSGRAQGNANRSLHSTGKDWRQKVTRSLLKANEVVWSSFRTSLEWKNVCVNSVFT